MAQHQPVGTQPGSPSYHDTSHAGRVKLTCNLHGKFFLLLRRSQQCQIQRCNIVLRGCPLLLSTRPFSPVRPCLGHHTYPRREDDTIQSGNAKRTISGKRRSLAREARSPSTHMRCRICLRSSPVQSSTLADVLKASPLVSQTSNDR